MGTRNITSVIKDGKQLVCQYCQWDGYPTYAGLKILEFLRDADMEHFKKALDNTRIMVTDYDKAVSYTGSTKDYGELSGLVYKAKCDLNERNNKWPDFNELFTYMVEEAKVPVDDVENYFVWTRDTGCEVLPLLYNRPLDKSPLELSAVTDDYNGDYSWDIQGVYVIDLDKEVVRMTFNGHSCEFDMHDLSNQIDSQMLFFEKASYALDEKEDMLKSMRGKSEGHRETLWEMADDITGKITSEMKKEEPDLFADPKDSEWVTSQGRGFVYGLLCEQVGLERGILPFGDRANSLGDYSIPKLMGKLENNAWYGKQPTSIRLAAGDNIIVLEGYTYEPSYESFSATSSISLNGKVLYGLDSRNVAPYSNEVYQMGVFNTLDEAIAHIKEVCKDDKFILISEEKSSLNSMIQSAESSIAKSNHDAELRTMIPAPEH